MLKLSDPHDRKLPFILFVVMAAFLVFFFVSRDEMPALSLYVGCTVCAFLAGGMFMMWTRRPE